MMMPLTYLLLVAKKPKIPSAEVNATSAEPKFHSRECFQHNGIREPWEPTTPDGIVVLKGYEKYLVMFRDEAEKTGGGPKWASAISFETMDTQFHSIACPQSWKDHTHEEKAHRVLYAY